MERRKQPTGYGRPMPVKNTTVASVSELLSHLLAAVDQRRWFRGQGCDTFPLTPSLVRKAGGVDAAALLAIERRLITRFRQKSLPYWSEGYPQDDWEHLFAMQHHGAPTRLLDWSQNALVGAYFAADHDPAQCDCGTGACKPTLWVLDPVGFNRKNSRLDGMGDSISVLATTDPVIDPWSPGTEPTIFAPWPIAIWGTHNSARIVAQQGTFTVAGKELAPLEVCPAAVEHDTLERITIDCDRQEIFASLRLLGITQAVVFPGLPGIAADLTAEELG